LSTVTNNIEQLHLGLCNFVPESKEFNLTFIKSANQYMMLSHPRLT